MGKDLQIGLLLDYYRGLLTPHQCAMMDESYGLDLSLSEIASRHGVSRQAVQDVLRRSEAQLRDLEQTLGLMRRDAQIARALGQLLSCVRAAQAEAGDSQPLSRAKHMLTKWIEGGEPPSGL